MPVEQKATAQFYPYLLINLTDLSSAIVALRHKVTFQDHGISHSFYFRDPDGHQLEIATYELE